MKDIVNQAKKALSVKHTVFLLTLVFITSCGVKRYDVVDNTYDIKRFKSKSGYSSININSFDFKTKDKISPWININDVALEYVFNEKGNFTNPLQIKVIPNNHFNIEIYYLRRHTVKIKELYLKDGDSIVINAYLKEDTRPIIN